jgi:hypothetical protein
MLRRRALEERGRAAHRVTPLRERWQENLHPALVGTAEALVTSGAFALHDHIRALNSSQAFALNLFLPLAIGRRDGIETWLGAVFGRELRLDGLDFEFYGSGDILAETGGSVAGLHEPHSAADVALHLRDAHGGRGLLLVEVKLSEVGFSACNGATSAGNRDREVCADAGAFFAEPGRCYLRRPLRAARDRRYQEIFERAHGTWRAAFPGFSEAGPCPFRGDGQQPMRNHALALGCVQAGLADFWALALVHHDGNPDVPGPWDAYRAAIVDRAAVLRWPASALLPALDVAVPGCGVWIAERYFLDAESAHGLR